MVIHASDICAECTSVPCPISTHYYYVSALDVLINNAGVMHTANLENITEEHFDDSMAVNVKSALRLTQNAVKWLEQSDLKTVVNVSSIAGLRAYPGTLPYKISKAAMDQMTRCTGSYLLATKVIFEV